jgi:hypothetical protein
MEPQELDRIVTHVNARRRGMMEEKIRQSAETLVRAHGGRAAAICAETAAKWQQRGDQAAAQLWLDILRAVRKLEAEKLKWQVG